MSVNSQLADIQRILGEHTGLLKGIVGRNMETSGSIRNLWKSQSAQDQKIAKLETKASVFGAAAGALVAGVIAGFRWLFVD